MQPDSPAARLRNVVIDFSPKLYALDEKRASTPPAPGKWSPKEILGHLIDSASVNHERFVRARETTELVFPGYDQNAWVARQHYADATWRDLVELWRALNLNLARVMETIPNEILEQPRSEHNLHQIAFHVVPATEPATLAYFLADYVDHLEHHLSEIPLGEGRALRVGAVRVFTRDLPRALDFYTGVVGATIASSSEEDGFAVLASTGALVIVERVEGTEADDLVGRFVGVSFTVPNVVGTFATWTAAGVRFTGPPAKQGWGGTLAHFEDPDGNVLTLVGPD